MAVTGVKTRPSGTFDAELEFKDAGVLKVSAAAQVDSAARVIDVGTGLFKACMFIDVSAIDLVGNDEIYDIVIQGSTVAAFATDTEIKELASINLSAAEVKRTDCNVDDSTGRLKIYFDNENNLEYYRYLRVYTVVGGSPATGINYAAYAVSF